MPEESSAEFDSFDAWYQERYKNLFTATDDEIREWSLFMGYQVTPMEIAELRVSLAAKLRMEGRK